MPSLVLLQSSWVCPWSTPRPQATGRVWSSCLLFSSCFCCRFLASGVYFNVTFYNPLFYDEFNQNTGLVAFSSTSNIDFFFGAYADLAVSSPEENVVLKVDATATVASYDTNVLGLSG